MIVRQFHIVMHGNPKDPAVGTVATATLTHHRMFWKGRPSQENIEKCVKECCEFDKWQKGICVGIYEIGTYPLWKTYKYDGSDGEPINPAGCPQWLGKAARKSHRWLTVWPKTRKILGKFTHLLTRCSWKD